MGNHLFTGVCTALVTPFIDGKVNYPLFKILIQRQIDSGIKAIVLCGTTGEASTLSDEEKLQIIQIGKEYSRGQCLIIAGTGSNATAHTIELSMNAEKVGADALLVVSPYYNKATPDGLFSHYLTVAHSVHIPVIIYNVPSRTGLDIPVSVYKKLSAVSNIVGVKEAAADISKIARIRNACRENFSVWTGNDDLTVPAMALGAQGVISVTSNICPSQMLAMTNAAQNDDFETAGEIQCALQPLNDLLFCEVNPIPVKAAMGMIGFDCGSCRLPLCDISKSNYDKLKRYFAE